MARIRTIKPEFPHSESMGNVSRDARLTFIQLWTLADDSGRLRGNSRMLASLLFPYDDDAPGLIDTWLEELEREHCIVRYSADGTSCLQVCNWLSHQKIDKPSPSKLPQFDESSRTVAKPRERSSGDLDQGSRIKDRDQGPRKGSRVSIPSESHSDAKPSEDVRQIFEHWKSVWEHPRASLDLKRTAAIKRALKGYAIEDLCAAISGYRNSPHHAGQNDRQTIYDDISLLLRDAAHIDAGIRFAENPQALTSDLSNHNVAVLKQWTPSESRDETGRRTEISGDNGGPRGGLRKAALAGPH